MARRDVDAALNINPQDETALKLLGYIAIKDESYRRAEEILTKALTLETWEYSRAVILTNLSFVAVMRGWADTAIARANGAIKLDSELSRAYRNRGFAYYQKGKFDRSIADLQKALSLPDPPSDAFYYLGLAFEKRGNRGAAAKAFKESVRLGALREFAASELTKLRAQRP